MGKWALLMKAAGGLETQKSEARLEELKTYMYTPNSKMHLSLLSTLRICQILVKICPVVEPV